MSDTAHLTHRTDRTRPADPLDPTPPDQRRRSGRGSRRRRRFSGVVVALAVLGGAAVGPQVGAAGCWRPPVDGEIVDPFRRPACPWCPGNRGLEYRTGGRSIVRSVAAGHVTFSGVVAGTRYVVVRHGDGATLTYGRMSSIGVRRGARVVSGAPLGTADGPFFLGLRIDGVHVDPAPRLGRYVSVPRLVPLDGTPPRRASTRLRCEE